MKTIKIKNRILGKEPFVIAEIGNNHQGSLQKAIQLIKAAKDWCFAVKFQKRFNKDLYTEEFYNTLTFMLTLMQKLMESTGII